MKHDAWTRYTQSGTIFGHDTPNGVLEKLIRGSRQTRCTGPLSEHAQFSIHCVAEWDLIHRAIEARPYPEYSRANSYPWNPLLNGILEHVKQSMPDYGIGFQVKALTTF
jgi:hypothetical protein